MKQHRVTPAAIEAFERGDPIALHRALGLRPWHPSPLDVSPDWTCPWPEGSGGAMGWPLVLELRAELEKAVREGEA